MVRIEDVVSGAEPKDTIEKDAEHALVAASHYDGGYEGDINLLIRQFGHDVVMKAIENRWFERDGDKVHISGEGQDHYKNHLRDGVRHAPEYREPDTREFDAAVRAGMFPYLMPPEHTRGCYMRDTLPPPPPGKKIEDE
jgi:hypothetical protein